ncbi:unnamed protein product [Arabis nemorensis]|uniref:Uncharacterized protein n=1 Tax=Arabis nemorensis TaxID=586526 RepID=A0A565BUT9_9BRAS|nr:unnamed protein product [Arabis nemorensis]
MADFESEHDLLNLPTPPRDPTLVLPADNDSLPLSPSQTDGSSNDAVVPSNNHVETLATSLPEPDGHYLDLTLTCGPVTTNTIPEIEEDDGGSSSDGCVRPSWWVLNLKIMMTKYYCNLMQLQILITASVFKTLRW